MTKFEDLIGLTLTEININDNKDEILFVSSNGDRYKMRHYQDC